MKIFLYEWCVNFISNTIICVPVVLLMHGDNMDISAALIVGYLMGWILCFTWVYLEKRQELS